MSGIKQTTLKLNHNNLKLFRSHKNTKNHCLKCPRSPNLMKQLASYW